MKTLAVPVLPIQFSLIDPMVEWTLYLPPNTELASSNLFPGVRGQKLAVWADMLITNFAYKLYYMLQVICTSNHNSYFYLTMPFLHLWHSFYNYVSHLYFAIPS